MDTGVIVFISIAGAFVWFLLLAIAIGVGVSAGMTSAHKHIKRWEWKEANRERPRRSYKPSEIRARREAQAAQAGPSLTQPAPKSSQWR